MTKTGTKFLDPMLSWRRVLMAMHPLYSLTAEDIAAASGVPIRTVKPYLCQFRHAGLVSQEEMDPQEWYRDVRKELVEKAFSLRELIEAHRADSGNGKAVFDSLLSEGGIAHG